MTAIVWHYFLPYYGTVLCHIVALLTAILWQSVGLAIIHARD